MINIDIGRITIIDETEEDAPDGPYLRVAWLEYNNVNIMESPNISVSGCTRKYHSEIKAWKDLLNAVKDGRNGIIKLSSVYELIMTLPKSPEPENSACIRVEDCLKYWTEKATNELGNEAYFSYT